MEKYFKPQSMFLLPKDLKSMAEEPINHNYNRLTRFLYSAGVINPPFNSESIEDSVESIIESSSEETNNLFDNLVEVNNNGEEYPNLTLKPFDAYDGNGNLLSHVGIEKFGFSSVISKYDFVTEENVSISNVPLWYNYNIQGQNLVHGENANDYIYDVGKYKKGAILEGLSISFSSYIINTSFKILIDDVEICNGDLSPAESESVESESLVSSESDSNEIDLTNLHYVVNLKHLLEDKDLKIILTNTDGVNLITSGINFQLNLEITNNNADITTSVLCNNIDVGLSPHFPVLEIGAETIYTVIAIYQNEFSDLRQGGLIPPGNTPFNARRIGKCEIGIISGQIEGILPKHTIQLGTFLYQQTSNNTATLTKIGGCNKFLANFELNFNNSGIESLIDETKSINADISNKIAELTKNSTDEIYTFSMPVGSIIYFCGKLNSATGNFKDALGNNINNIYYVGSKVLCDSRALPQDSFPALYSSLGTTMGSLPDYVVLPNYTSQFLRGSVENIALNNIMVENTMLPIQGGDLFGEYTLNSSWGCVKSTPGRGYLGSGRSDFDNYAQQIDSTKQTRVVDGQTVIDTRYNGIEVAPTHKKIYILIETGVDIKNWLNSISESGQESVLESGLES